MYDFLINITGANSVFVVGGSEFEVVLFRVLFLVINAWFIFGGFFAVIYFVRLMTGKVKMEIAEAVLHTLEMYNVWAFTCATLWWGMDNYVWAMLGLYGYGLYTFITIGIVMWFEGKSFIKSFLELPGSFLQYLGLK